MAGEEDRSSARNSSPAEGRHTFEDIAKARERQLATVVNTVATLVERGDLEFQPDWIDRNNLRSSRPPVPGLGLNSLRI